MTGRPVTRWSPWACRASACCTASGTPTSGASCARSWSSDGCASAGLDLVVDEVVTTTNEAAGTVRGMHYQAAPHEETKTLWVTSGALVDVLVDLPPGPARRTGSTSRCG